jgi:hypothetical protein
MAIALHPGIPKGLIGHLVVEDISPRRARLSDEFQAYIEGMKAVLERKSGSRKEADIHLTEKLAALKEKTPEIDTVSVAGSVGILTKSRLQSMEIKQFLLTNLSPEKGGAPMSFRIPLDILEVAVPNFGDFPYVPGERTWEGPTLVIRGKRSK